VKELLSISKLLLDHGNDSLFKNNVDQTTTQPFELLMELTSDLTQEEKEHILTVKLKLDLGKNSQFTTLKMDMPLSNHHMEHSFELIQEVKDQKLICKRKLDLGNNVKLFQERMDTLL